MENEVRDAICIDVGASHGGFTRTLLEHGAKRVYAVDVAYGIFDYNLRIDPRVRTLERRNARNIDPSWFVDRMEDNPEKKLFITCDVSFISLKTMLQSIAMFLPKSGMNFVHGLFLVKPQFEDSKATRRGILLDENRREEIVEAILVEARKLGFRERGRFDLPEEAGKNKELFVALSWEKDGVA